MFICDKNWSCCKYQYADRLEDIEEEFRDCNNLIEVAEVKHGRWCCAETGYVTCDKCNQSVYVGGYTKGETLDIMEKDMFEYCPHCGAKMSL